MKLNDETVERPLNTAIACNGFLVYKRKLIVSFKVPNDFSLLFCSIPGLQLHTLRSAV